MIKVALVTTHFPERCGLAQYASDLCKHISDIEFTVIGRPFDFQTVVNQLGNCEIVHINHVRSMFDNWTSSHIQHIRSMGKKVMCTYQESGFNPVNDFTRSFDRTVVHRPCDLFDYVPHGIWDLEPAYPDLMEYIGSAGFPFPFKNYPLIAEVARRVNRKVLIFAADSHHVSSSELDLVKKACPEARVITEYLAPDVVINWLSRCAFTMFPQSNGNAGVSGSVRFGIAAKRPVVISDNFQFSDIAAYKDEMYVIPRSSPTVDDAMNVVRGLMLDIADNVARVPSRIFQEMGWPKIAKRYSQIYKELVGHD